MALEDVIIENIEFFETVIKAIGGIFVLYVAYAITNSVLNIKRYRHLKEIRYDIDLVKKKLNIKGHYREPHVSKKHHYYFLSCGIIFGVIALLHFARILAGWNVFIGELEIPFGVSWVVFILFGVLAFLAFRINK